MEEKRTIKISLGTVICIFIIIILIVALGITYYIGFIKEDNKENNTDKNYYADNVINNEVNNEKNSTENTLNVAEENTNNQKTPKLQLGKKYEYEKSAKYGKNGEVLEAGGGSSIIFKDDYTVESSAWAIPGGGDSYRGTYKIDGNKIVVKLTQMYDIEWVDYGAQNNEFIYTIISDSKIKEGNNILEVKD